MTCRNLRQPKPAEIVIIGVGNADRGDDGAGVAVAKTLSDDDLDNVDIHQLSGNCLALFDLWSDAERVIIIDAVQSGGKPGTIYRLDAGQHDLPPSLFGNSSHSFGVAQAVELARSLRQLPPHLTIYGIEGHRFDRGAPLSTEVAQALPEIVARLRNEVRYWQC